MDLVSVIMPCYNDGAYLRDSVASLKAQTYPRIELIVIDDGSDQQETRDALALVKEYPRSAILHTEHVGPSRARNFGIDHANGKYILPLDADDTIEPTYIAKAVGILERREEVGAVYCYADLFGEKSGRWELPDYSFEAMLLDNIVFATAVYRRADWVKIGGYSDEFPYGMEDYDFWLSLLELGREIVQIPEVLFHYRIKPTSRTTRFMDNYDHVQETYVTLYERHKPLYDRHRDLYAKGLRRALVHQLMDRQYLLRELEQVKKNYAAADRLMKSIPYPVKKAIRRLFIRHLPDQTKE